MIHVADGRLSWCDICPSASGLVQWLGEIPRRCLQAYRCRNEITPAEKPIQWTDVHSHFLQMGGYIFKFQGEASYVDIASLFSESETYEGMHVKAMREALLQRQDCEEELMDRSKTNLLTRTITYGQMVWFGINFIGRAIEGLTITKLEVASLAYVVMTLLTYYFWMDKPLDVDCPIVVVEAAEGDFGMPHVSPWSPRLDSMKPFVSQDAAPRCAYPT